MQGLLKVHRMPPPVDSLQAELDGVKVASAASLNDCMMLNLYRYKLLLIVDLDEVILPRMHFNFSQVL